MTTEDFLEDARKAKIRPNAFVLDGEGNECYVLSGNANHWSVYYSERGLETQKHHFGSQSAALEHLLQTLKNDPSTKLES